MNFGKVIKGIQNENTKSCCPQTYDYSIIFLHWEIIFPIILVYLHLTRDENVALCQGTMPTWIGYASIRTNQTYYAPVPKKVQSDFGTCALTMGKTLRKLS